MAATKHSARELKRHPRPYRANARAQTKVGSIYAALALATSGLLASGMPSAQAAQGDWLVDTAVLYYQENDSRLRAIEPVLSLKRDLGDDRLLGFTFSYTTLSGASPTGAVAQPDSQTFTSASAAQGLSGTAQTRATQASPSPRVRAADSDDDDSHSTTGASGRTEEEKNNPLACGSSLAGPYTVPANQLAGIPRFGDCRVALSTSYSAPINDRQKIQLGAAYSKENDFLSTAVNVSLAQDFNQKLTTLSVGGNFEYDVSSPYGGAPLPLSRYDAGQKIAGTQTKQVTELLLGVTQIMNAKWLMQVNLGLGKSHGEHNDPYKVFSVVDPVTGLLSRDNTGNSTFFESRPSERQRASIYWQNKWAVGQDVLDLSYRRYQDSWQIKADTVEAKYRFTFKSFYLTPQYRWYRQTGASFYAPYFFSATPASGYASADYRLAPMQTQSVGVKWGLPLGPNKEFGVQVMRYEQTGLVDTSNAPGYLKNRNLFPDVNSVDITLNYSFVF